MAYDVKSVLNRSSDTLVQDAIGAVSLGVMLVVGLYLPGLL